MITVCKDSKVMFTMHTSLTAPMNGIGDLLANKYCCFSIEFVFYSWFLDLEITFGLVWLKFLNFTIYL